MKETTERWLIRVAVFLFLVNIGCAWWTMFGTNSHIATPASDREAQPIHEALKQARPEDAANLVQYRIRALEADVHLKAVSNKQSMVVTSMAGAFSLIAVGLALFVMGARGARDASGNPNEEVNVELSAGEHGKLLIYATSPGLLCFVLAAIVMCFAVGQKTTIDLRPYDLQPSRGATGAGKAVPKTNGTANNIEQLRERGAAGTKDQVQNEEGKE